MIKYAFRVAYDGTKYCGWQKQKSASGPRPSIQAKLESALFRISRERTPIVGSGRTDAGVHAVAQVAHFVLKKKELEPWKVINGLNAVLPRDIRVSHLQRVPIEFHAQRSVQKKQYSYYFQQGPCPLPHLEPFSWWIRKTLDIEKMRTAILALCGEHDFKPFQASGGEIEDTVREIVEAEIERIALPFPGLGQGDAFSLVRFRLVGTGFLKQMVRGLAGTLLQIGEGRRPEDAFKVILDNKKRALVGQTAPARALWLEKVWYHGLEWEDVSQHGLKPLTGL